MIVVEQTLVREVEVSAATCFWNTWDHEHLYYVHDNFCRAKVLYEDKNSAALLTTIKIPIFKFLRSTGLHVMIQRDVETTKVINIGLFGIPSVLTMKMEDIGNGMSRITNEYKFYLEGWKKILAPIIRMMIPRWNDGNWAEDQPLKIRREKMLKHGFRDYQGLPEKVADREAPPPSQRDRLPLFRAKESVLNEFLSK